ncbi:efflux RND transporter permease subunit [Ralstonia insidiosa]|jgi:multidrug efflux pump subunit AcrB|uniref:efflux RND transporter permease subunit n=1 Tax=Ralstonia TaxID=48736 RepID=UPI000664BB7F|nr:efflux RND transporter permease subunit [Ralstonia insidiosa]KMW44605.1 acriflavin resistance protein [Ralstonia sp. MD27]MBX3775257.1 efflux RND transporter permease subunit [Ralstonia pickettii]NPA01742.1 efflux RND transporter permease subunit [Betaproteobacteria bacterium]MBA9859422.1 efflux RND transporter permease subunit [Ralstonia insidiosa]MBA9872870.1 efflux RND transporter permease subunit [Ralstonia insidiosa]
MKLTESAFNSTRLTFFAALLILVSGVVAFLSFPSQEEPSTTVRDAIVIVANPGLPAERMEQLVARPLEERLRQLPELKHVTSTVRPGTVILQVNLRDEVRDLMPVWQRMRAKIEEARPLFPAGTLPPQINDDFGRVAIASIAVTAPGFSMSEMREPLKRLREGIYAIKGVQGVSFHGLQDERVYIEFDRTRLAGLGLGANAVLQQLHQQNVVLSGGQVVLSGLNSAVVASGEIRSLEALRDFVLAVPASAGTAPATVRLGDIAQIRVLPADPPESAAIYRGDNAVVLGVSMRPGQNIKMLGQELKERVAQLEQQLPAGFSLDFVTYQADVVEREMGSMNRVMAETIVIVMAVVVLFLGWRAGIIVGSIVPLTILATLLVMRALSIELHIVSMAAIIIALGLLVDNGIVIAEDVERRLAMGEDRRTACIRAGQSLGIPLLTSSLVIIFAFSPFFFGNTTVNEYLRPLVIVVALSLLSSWLLCLTVTPLLCYFFLKPGHHNADEPPKETGFYAGYARVIRKVLEHKGKMLAAMTVLFIGSMVLLSRVPAGFLPPSERPQYQVAIELQPGSDARRTQTVVRDLSLWLSDKKANPEVTTSIGYVADGGPRVVLVLSPPLPASHVGYFTVSVQSAKDVAPMIERTRQWMAQRYPDVRVDAKRFSRSANDAGTVAYRISGPDETVLRDIGTKIEGVLRPLPGMVQVRNDWGPRVPRVDVQIDQRKARRLGISSEDIATSLGARYTGVEVSVLRDGDTLVPLVVRGSDAERARPEDLANTLIHPASGAAPVPLSALASVSLSSEPSAIRRRDLVRTLTVEGRSTQATAQQIVDRAAPDIAKIALPPGYRIEMGAEIEEAADSNASLKTYLPLAVVAMLLLFVWQFNSFRKLTLIVGIIPFAMIGVAPALLLGGEPLGFMANFGILSLGGIIVNNAVLLLERIEAELAAGKPRREAVVSAAMARLRPIVMTKLTCVAGLIPLLLFGGSLWAGMALTIIGGLLLGTLITLGLVPVLYELLFGGRLARWLEQRRSGEASGSIAHS